MKKRMLVLLLCLSILGAPFVGTVIASDERVKTAYDGNLLKTAAINPYYLDGGVIPISAAPEEEESWSSCTANLNQVDASVLEALVLVIVDARVVERGDGTSEYWYKVEAAQGHTLPEALVQNPWIFQNLEGDSPDYDTLIIDRGSLPEETGPEETEPEETEPVEPEAPQTLWKPYSDFIREQNEQILADPSVYVGFSARFDGEAQLFFAAEPGQSVLQVSGDTLAEITVIITDAFVSEEDGSVWYKLEAAGGSVLPDTLAETPYVRHLENADSIPALQILPLMGTFVTETVYIQKNDVEASAREQLDTAGLPGFFPVTPTGNGFYDLGDISSWHDALTEEYRYVKEDTVMLIAPEVTVTYQKLLQATSAGEFSGLLENTPETVRSRFTEKHLAELDRWQEQLWQVTYDTVVDYNGVPLGVTVSGPVPTTGITLSVDPVSPETVLAEGFGIADAADIITSLDIRLLRGDGTQWQPEPGRRIAVSIDMAPLGIGDGTVVSLHHKHGEHIEVFDVFLVLDGKVTVYTGGLSIYTVATSGSTVATGTVIDVTVDSNNDGIWDNPIKMEVGETKIFYVDRPTTNRNRRGTWSVTDTSGAVYYTVYADTSVVGIGNGGLYVPWIEITALKETTGLEDLVLTFNYRPNSNGYGEGSQTYILQITPPTNTNGERTLYLKDMVNTTGSIVATLVDADGNEIPDGLDGASFTWSRSDDAFIVPMAYGENNISVNVAKDHGGLVEARKDADGYKPVTYRVDAILADGTKLYAEYTVFYQSEIINANFEFPDVTGVNTNYIFLVNGWPELHWKTTGPGTGTNLTKDIEYGIINSEGGTDFGVPQAADAPNGKQFAELNAEAVGTLYQDIIAAPGENIEWDFFHAARRSQSWAQNAENNMLIVIGATEDAQKLTTQAELTDLGTAAKNKAAELGITADFLIGKASVTVQDGNGASYEVWYHEAGTVPQNGNTNTYYNEDNNYGWTALSGSYTVPENDDPSKQQYRTRIFFVSDSERANFGNLIDTAKAGQYKEYLIEYYVESFSGTEKVVKHISDKNENEEALMYSFVDIRNLQYFLNGGYKDQYYYLHKIDINGGNYPYSLRYDNKASLYIEKYPGTVTKDEYGNPLTEEKKEYYSQFDIVMQIYLRDTVVAVEKVIEFPAAMTHEQRLALISGLEDGYVARFQLLASGDEYNAVDGTVITQRNPNGTYTGYISMDDGMVQPPRNVPYTLTEIFTTELTGLELAETKFTTTMYKNGQAQTPTDSENSSQFILSNDTGTVAEIKVTNVYTEKMTTIYYKAVGKGKVRLTEGGEYLDTPFEVLPFYSGSAKGAVAVAGEGANFMGWFTDEACTKPVQPVHGVYDKDNATFTPNANIIDKTEVTYYAKFETGSIVINRENAPNQSFVYRVTNSDGTIDFYVTVDCEEDGKGSTEIFEVGNGTYTITEVTDWSWRYPWDDPPGAAREAHISADHLRDTVLFDEGIDGDKLHWLSDLAEIVRNIFGGGASS